MSGDNKSNSLKDGEGFWLLLDGFPAQTWAHPIGVHPKVIGRESSCDIVLVHEKVSRQHAEVWTEEATVHLRDLGSRNGTAVDGVRITQRSLAAGQRFQVGDLTLRVLHRDGNNMASVGDISASTVTTEGAGHAEETVAFFLQQKRAEIERFSKAQYRVLRMLLSGASEAEAAAELHLSPSTVHSHVAAIYKIMQVNSRGGLMAKFIDPRISERAE